MTTLRQAFEAARARFREAGLDTPELDARLLAAHAAGVAASAILLDGGRGLSGEQVARLEDLVARRLAREPVARLLGSWEFHGLEFALEPSTLVPRPDTETLVDAALDARGDRDAPLVIGDLGVGSGAILVAMLARLPNAVGVAVDRDAAALRVALGNAARHGQAGRVHGIVGSWADALPTASFDAILSNPPYIATAELAGLDPEVTAHDPMLALDGGVDGLVAYRALLPGVFRALKPGGLLGLEIGETQGAEVSALVAAAGFALAGPPVRDLGGNERVVLARRPE